MASTAVELPRSPIADPRAVWGNGPDFIVVSPTQAHHSATGVVDLPGAGDARDLAGNAANDVLVVGGGATFARHYNGSAWTPATVGTVAAASLRAVTAVGGAFIAVGDGGVIARFVGGAWQSIASNTTSDFTAVAALDANQFVAAGPGGGALHARELHSRACCDHTHGCRDHASDDIYAVGDGQALHYNGRGWNPVNLKGKTPDALATIPNAVWFGEGGSGGSLERLVRVKRWR
jgi:hypothetical protein